MMRVHLWRKNGVWFAGYRIGRMMRAYAYGHTPAEAFDRHALRFASAFPAMA